MKQKFDNFELEKMQNEQKNIKLHAWEKTGNEKEKPIEEKSNDSEKISELEEEI